MRRHIIPIIILLLCSASPALAQRDRPFADGLRLVGATLPASCTKLNYFYHLTAVHGGNQPGLYRCNGANYVAVGGASNPFDDSTALVKGSGDATKQLRLEVDGFTTGTTRVATFPDASITVARSDAAQTLNGEQTIAGDIALGANRLKWTTGGLIKTTSTNLLGVRSNDDSSYAGMRFSRVLLSAADDSIRIGLGQTNNNIELVAGSEINVATSTTQSNTAKDLGLKRHEAGAWAVTNGGSGGGTIKIGDPGAKPTCDSTRRGMFWIEEGGAGVADTVEVCSKDAGDLYAWRALY